MKRSQYHGVAPLDDPNSLTGSRLEQKSTYALAHAFDESLTALLSRSNVRLRHQTGHAVVETETQLLPRDHHSGAKPRDLVRSTNSLVIIQSRQVAESLG